jgi:MFS family permease
MPYLAFAANFLSVMVMGLLGPAVPAIIQDLHISYARAGLCFTAGSLAYLFSAPLGGIASDTPHRGGLFAAVALLLAVGLIGLALAPTYALILAAVFFLSLFGGAAISVGQSIMIDLYPAGRERLLSMQGLFASLGSFAAPLLVALNYARGVSWRWPYGEAAILAMLLFLAVLLTPMQKPSEKKVSWADLRHVLGNSRVLASAFLLFLAIAPEWGFVFWLAEHFKTDLGVSLQLSSAVVSVFLVGMIAGRLFTSRLADRLRPRGIVQGGLILAMAGLAVFLLVPSISVKVCAILVYGLGVAPVFPILMACGTSAAPDRPGTATGVLYAFVSLGSMLFPLLLGVLASVAGIQRSYAFIEVVLLGLLIAVTLLRNMLFTPAASGRGAGPAE